jgi:hypothetical protein
MYFGHYGLQFTYCHTTGYSASRPIVRALPPSVSSKQPSYRAARPRTADRRAMWVVIGGVLEYAQVAALI